MPRNDKASDMFRDVAGKAQGMVNIVTAQAGEATEGMQEVGAIWKS